MDKLPNDFTSTKDTYYAALTNAWTIKNLSLAKISIDVIVADL